MRIRIELDTDPPPLVEYEVLPLLTPIPFHVRLFDLPCLFAGKLHPILRRDWKGRVKRRDFYDFLWYLGRQIPCNVRHLQARMTQTGHWKDARELDAAHCASFCGADSNRWISIRQEVTYARSSATKPIWSCGTAPSSIPWRAESKLHRARNDLAMVVWQPRCLECV